VVEPPNSVAARLPLAPDRSVARRVPDMAPAVAAGTNRSEYLAEDAVAVGHQRY